MCGVMASSWQAAKHLRQRVTLIVNEQFPAKELQQSKQHINRYQHQSHKHIIRPTFGYSVRHNCKREAEQKKNK